MHNIYNHDHYLYTQDGCFKNYIFKNGHLVVPYISLGLSEHELSPTSRIRYLDKCYIIIIDVNFLAINNESPSRMGIIINNSLLNYKNVGDLVIYESLIVIGGKNYTRNAFFSDLFLLGKEIKIQVFDNYKISENIWRAYTDDCLFPSNMDRKEVDDFFNHKNLPDNLKELLAI